MKNTKILYIRHNGIDKSAFLPSTPNQIGKRLILAMQHVLRKLSPDEKGALLYGIESLEINSLEEAIQLFELIEKYVSKVKGFSQEPERKEPERETPEIQESQKSRESQESQGDVEVKFGKFKF